MKNQLLTFVCALVLLGVQSLACTGITLKSQDGATLVARTIEWAGSPLKSTYVVVPRGYEQQSLVPGGEKNGMKMLARYGYVGLTVEMDEFVTEGLNEMGLSAGLFYFPGYGKYEAYCEADRSSSIADLQLVSWLLGNFATVDEAIEGLKKVHVVAVDPRSSAVHWRITDASGRQVVLEIMEGQMHFHENPLGVLTNSPDLPWHWTNLNNYVNLEPGSHSSSLGLSPFGGGSGMLGLPGDVTPPSRFVRAYFYQQTAPQWPTAEETMNQCFQILNNFDIPIGIQHPSGQAPAMTSATHWTVVSDMRARRIYYRTMTNSAIRCLDLTTIDFRKVKFQSHPLDTTKTQPVEMVKVG